MPALAFSAPARAQDAPSAPEVQQSQPQPKPKRRWYGYQTLIGMGVSDALMLLSFPLAYGTAGATTLFTVGAVGHVLTPPIVHWAHGHGLKGLLSLGLTAGAPLVLGGIGLAIGWNIDSGSQADPPLPIATIAFLYLGTLIGSTAATAVDIAVLAKEDVETPRLPPPEAKAALPLSIGLVPTFEKNRAGVALIGQF